MHTPLGNRRDREVSKAHIGLVLQRRHVDRLADVARRGRGSPGSSSSSRRGCAGLMLLMRLMWLRREAAAPTWVRGLGPPLLPRRPTRLLLLLLLPGAGGCRAALKPALWQGWVPSTSTLLLLLLLPILLLLDDAAHARGAATAAAACHGCRGSKCCRTALPWCSALLAAAAWGATTSASLRRLAPRAGGSVARGRVRWAAPLLDACKLNDGIHRIVRRGRN